METTLEVQEQSQVAAVRRLVADMAGRQGLSAVDAGRAAIVATEASTNLVKYGKHGAVTVSLFTEWGVSGLQIVAADKGPGFANFVASARDGHSTGGSLGIGLGAIMRASDVFDVFSVQAQGSALLSRVVKGASRPLAPAGALALGARTTPKRGQVECGDAWSYSRKGRWQRLCVVDGLGHGPLAARAASEAVAVLQAATERDTPLTILARAHEALKPMRGAVMAVAAIDTVAGELCFSGVGNIAGILYTGDEVHHLLSVEGVVGYNARPTRMQTHPWNATSTVVLHSDGLSSRLSLSRYPGLAQRHPGLIASVMHRDFARDTDDATVLVARPMP